MQRDRAVQQSVFVSVLLPPHAMLEGMHPCKVRSQVVLFAFFFFFPRLLSVSIPSRACLVFQGDLSGNMGRNGWIGAMSDDDGEDEVERDGSTTITC